MARILTACAFALALVIGHTAAPSLAEEAQRPAAAETDAGEKNLPSIAEEVAEVGPEGTEQDGMSRTMDEMIEAESEDGCDGPIGQREGTGCN